MWRLWGGWKPDPAGPEEPGAIVGSWRGELPRSGRAAQGGGLGGRAHLVGGS